MKKTILLIDDDQLLQKNFKKVAEAEGFNVISAFDGQEGLKLAKEKKPDLILLDLILPKMEGLKVLENLKQDKETSHLQVLILTNVSQETEKIQEALVLGAKGYLVKTEYSLIDIVKKIKEILK